MLNAKEIYKKGTTTNLDLKHIFSWNDLSWLLERSGNSFCVLNANISNG